ncbi:MAG: MGMT family protein [Phycisphaerales bacterium]|nr:MGMT family protein [Phycisphaerales bacterium]
MTFNQKAWAVCSRIPAGKVATYGEIARALGSNGARAVGNAMHNNPYAPHVPCHRVVGSDRRLTGYAGGLAKKERLLKAEGVEIRNGRVAPQSLCVLEPVAVKPKTAARH